MIAYFVLTRFNELYPESETHIHLDPEWLRHRLSLFKSVTLPSIECQTDQDFHWLVKLHCDTPEWVREELRHDKILTDYRKDEEIERLITTRRMYDALFLKFYPCNRMNCRYYFSDKIKSMIQPGTTKIITTSLDSDDGLSADHIETVKRHAVLSRFFDFEDGIVIRDEKFPEYARKIHKHASPFYSYCEKPSRSIRTCFYLPHHMASNTSYLKEIGWVQRIHDKNIANNVAHLPEIKSNEQLLKRFPYVRF